MAYSDKFFRFPVKLFLTKDLKDQQERAERLGIEIEDDELPDHVLGWDAVDVNDIRGFGTIFSKHMTLDDVRENGFDSTIIYLNYGREVGCCWPPDKFKQKLDEFVGNLERKKAEQEALKQEAQIHQVKIELEKVVREIDLTPPRKSLWEKIKDFFKSF